jgi:hypothetical protein
MNIILSCDAASLISVMICCTTLAIFNVLLLVELGAYTDRPGLRISCCGRCCCTGSASFSHMIAVPVVNGVACLDVVQLRRTALVRNVLVVDALGARCTPLLSSSPFTCLQP